MPLKLSLGRFSLADKISMTVIAVGLFSILLVYYISTSYKQFAYQHHTQSIQQIAYLEIHDLVENLKSNAIDLALSIEYEYEHEGEHDFRYRQKDSLTQQLNNQFHQYFVTASVIKLLKLYILDNDFTLQSISTEGINTGPDGELICPQLGHLALKRQGPERMHALSGMCLYRNNPVFAVIVPLGGLNPEGYIQISTDLAYSLQKIEQSLAMPIQMNLLNGKLIYQSKDWPLIPDNKHYLTIDLPILSKDNQDIMKISLKSNMTAFNKEITEHRNRVMSLALLTTALTVFIVLLVLRRSAITPLAKIYDVLEKVHLYSYNEEGRLLFEQLLEQIIQLRRKSKAGFSVMILDLTHFEKVNLDYGQETGDQLLLKVEQRLGSILRDSDLISWVGTDTPGHKLLPSGRKTQYRATIARLGGDEFGLLLPSAQNEEQANTVAQRIVETLNQTFHVKGHNINIECKIGISIYPMHGEDEKVLIRNADKAMYQAKSLKQTVFIFETET